jgi:hypothetical protein
MNLKFLLITFACVTLLVIVCVGTCVFYCVRRTRKRRSTTDDLFANLGVELDDVIKVLTDVPYDNDRPAVTRTSVTRESKSKRNGNDASKSKPNDDDATPMR